MNRIHDPRQAMEWAKRRSQQLLKDIEKLDSALQLDKLVELAAAFGKECVEVHAPLPAVVALFPGGAGYRTMAAPDRETMVELWGQTANYLAQRNARLALLIMDTWVGTDPTKRPSADGKRREALCVVAVAPDGRAVYHLFGPYERGGKIKWGASVAEPIEKGGQHMLRPWVATIDGITVPLVIPTKADGPNIRIFPPIDEQGNLRGEQ
jgi:hypothetical protein